MQTVPSLIGTGTAVAAAATGLVFGQPAGPDAPATTTTTTTTLSSSTTTTRRSTSRTSRTSRASTTFAPSASFITSRRRQPQRQISYDRDLPIGGAHCGSLAASTADPLSLSGFAPAPPPACPESLPLHDDPSSLPPIPHLPKTSSTKGLRRKLSLGRYRASASNVVEGKAPTSSSTGSWIRKFAIRPSSDEPSSSSSSITLDAPSTKHSHSLSLPILSGPHSFAPSRLLPRNKLVKRSPSVKTDQSASSSHSRSRSFLPHLRRPATSHQRSATIDHVSADVHLAATVPSSSSPSLDLRQADRDKHLAADSQRDLTRQTSLRAPGWISFFHSRRLAFGRGGMTNRSSEARPLGRGASGKRITLLGDEGRRKVHLVKPRMISTVSAPAVLTLRSERAAAGPRKAQADEPESETHILSGRSGRPSSMTFPHFPANDMPRTSNRLRRSKRTQSVDAATEAERLTLIRAMQHVSAPGGALQVPVDQYSGSLALSAAMHHRLVIPSTSTSSSRASHENATGTRATSNPRLLSHRRSHSSPLFAFPRTSTFHIDSPRISPFPSSPSSSSPSSPTAAIIAAVAAAQIGRPHQPSGSSVSSGVMSHLGPSTRCDRSSSMSISGSDTRAFIFGDDDDTDFKSDTMYDSLRTAASSCVRAAETPLDSVYDESPPSTAGNGKTKRMSVQEILGRVWDDDDRIVEEDENDVTAIRASDDDDAMPFPMHTTLTVPRLSPQSSHDNLSSAANDVGRLCLDDELDEDWGDDDVQFSPLSPPSKDSSINSRALGSQLRLALAGGSSDELESAGAPEAHRESRGGRRLSSLFDWIETPVLDKGDMDGPYPRSKSALGKQETDARGGRTSLRKGPTPAHIRSQSVPITQDGDSNAKPSSAKYGTWGLGTRPVSEDWDEDFDFDGGCGKSEAGGGGGGGDDPLGRSSSFLVPESIRASQPSVKAHSGQIRELSLLVNDLKRLCRHGRDMDMLGGPQRDLWEEAEGVIALASPDEDDDDECADRGSKPTEGECDAVETTVPSLGRLDGALENCNLEPAMSKTAVVRERHSPKRRSVFSPDDDIFGGANWPLTDDNNDSSLSSLSSSSGNGDAQPGRVGRPRTPVIQIDGLNDASGATRSVMEAMSRSLPRHRSPGVRYDKKVHFDTNSLRVLVRRAGELRDSLSDLVRHAENLTHTPSKLSRQERHAETSPAFTRVFDDPNASPKPVPIRSGGPDSMGDSSSPRKSPSPPASTHLHPMIVK